MLAYLSRRYDRYREYEFLSEADNARERFPPNRPNGYGGDVQTYDDARQGRWRVGRAEPFSPGDIESSGSDAWRVAPPDDVLRSVKRTARLVGRE